MADELSPIALLTPEDHRLLALAIRRQYPSSRFAMPVSDLYASAAWVILWLRAGLSIEEIEHIVETAADATRARFALVQAPPTEKAKATADFLKELGL